MSAKSINIMGVDYEVIQLLPGAVLNVYKESEHFEEVKRLIGENAQSFAGLCDALNCKIYINISLPDQKREKTLIHEIIEAVDQECCLELDHTKIQSITNAIFSLGLINVKELLKLEPEDLEISLDCNPRT
jgi:hypothetical protein